MSAQLVQASAQAYLSCGEENGNPLLNDLVIDCDDEPGIGCPARDIQTNQNVPDCFTHAMVKVRGCEIPRNVLQADTFVVGCGACEI